MSYIASEFGGRASKKLQDLKFGLEKENDTYDKIKNYLNCGDLNKSSKYGIIDFYNDTHYIELKSRRNKYNTFDTTIIGKNKIDFFKKLKKECYIIINFTDGLYYIKYNEDIFNNFEIKNETIIRDNKKENKINYHIPIIYLKEII
jgi:hypothetical protein